MRVKVEYDDRHYDIIEDVSSWSVDEHNNLHIHLLYNDVGVMYNSKKWVKVREMGSKI